MLTNPAFPGLVKIGHTARHPETRAAELSTTGVPDHFRVAWSHQVTDHEALEGVAHQRLAACRANDNREFFRCSVGQARRVIRQEARAQLLPWWRAWLHRLAHPLPRRSPPSRLAWRRSRRGDDMGLLMVAGGALGLVVTFRPYWLPPGLLRLLWHLPGLHR